MTTQWYDYDGSPLPADLPGYTGRLAKVVADKQLADAGGQVANFAINPGRQTQLVHLPQSVLDDAHYYIHVSGEPPAGNPDFGRPTPDPADPLSLRPARYVPVRVPVFDEAATLEVARAQAQTLKDAWQPDDPLPVLENIEKIYRWPYRAEMQFSLFELAIDESGHPHHLRCQRPRGHRHRSFRNRSGPHPPSAVARQKRQPAQGGRL